jgi:hypothetical protein
MKPVAEVCDTAVRSCPRLAGLLTMAIGDEDIQVEREAQSSTQKASPDARRSPW